MVVLNAWEDRGNTDAEDPGPGAPADAEVMGGDHDGDTVLLRPGRDRSLWTMDDLTADQITSVLRSSIPAQIEPSWSAK